MALKKTDKPTELKIRYQTLRSLLTETTIPAPEKELSDWAMKNYIRGILNSRFLEFKWFRIID